MEWNNLKNVKCPACSEKIVDAKIGYKCSNDICDFRISYERFQQVIKKMYAPKVYQEDTAKRNERWLNEL